MLSLPSISLSRGHIKPSALSINNILRETGLIPTVYPGKCLCADTGPRKRRFSAPVKTESLFALRWSRSLKGSHAPCSQYLPVPELKDNNYPHTNISRHADILIILRIAGLLGFTRGAITTYNIPNVFRLAENALNSWFRLGFEFGFQFAILFCNCASLCYWLFCQHNYWFCWQCKCNYAFSALAH